MLKRARLVAAFALALALGACGGKDFSDLDQFMAEKKARPGGVIAPIPTFKAYEPFAYSATRMRSPFDRPIAVRDIARLAGKNAIKPDMERPKEFLEQFTFDSLSMVGTLARGGREWALVRDPDGGIHRVTEGNFLGRDHGRVVELTDTYLAVVEIVSDGTSDGWVERPRTIELSGL